MCLHSQTILLHIYFAFSINILSRQGSGSFSDVIKEIRHVIDQTKLTRHRSVIALPLGGSKSDGVNDASKEAVKEDIMIVVSAVSGKPPFPKIY